MGRWGGGLLEQIPCNFLAASPALAKMSGEFPLTAGLTPLLNGTLYPDWNYEMKPTMDGLGQTFRLLA